MSIARAASSSARLAAPRGKARPQSIAAVREAYRLAEIVVSPEHDSAQDRQSARAKLTKILASLTPPD